MKKLSLFVFGLVLLGGPLFYSCEGGSENEVDPPEVAGAIGGIECIIKEVCIPEVIHGRELWFNSTTSICVPGYPYQCLFFTGKKHCFPVIVGCFWRWEEWWIDPWVWQEYIDPLEIYDFRVDLIDVIDPREDFVTFVINENLMGLQYYNEVPGLIDKETFIVHTTIELDEETVESMGLKGNVIPAGKYPVAYNEKSGTFNAIVSVSEYPITKERQIAVGKFEAGADLTEFLANPEFEVIEQSVVVETTERIELVGYTPNPEDPYPPKPWPWPWIAVFTPNDLSIGIQIGDPTPQPSKLSEELMLNDEIAKIVGIEPFLLTNENMEQLYDKELGVTTILIHVPQVN